MRVMKLLMFRALQIVVRKLSSHIFQQTCALEVSGSRRQKSYTCFFLKEDAVPRAEGSDADGVKIISLAKI